MSDTDAREPSRSWWQTVPGMLTGVAAIISAIAALIVALNGRPARSSEPSDPPQAAHTAAAPRAAAPSAAVSSARAGAGVELPAGAERTLSAGKLVLRIIDARVEPFNADTRLLRLTTRWTNNDHGFVRNYWWTLRLVIDGVPLAPEDPGLEQVEARSARELVYTFKVPAAGGSAVLAIANDTGERAEMPLVLP